MTQPEFDLPASRDEIRKAALTGRKFNRPRRLVAVGKFEAGQPVYAVCDPDLQIAGATAAAGKSWTANLRRPAGERP